MWQIELIERIVRHRVALLAAVVAISAVSTHYALQLEFDSDIRNWFLEDDQSLRTYREFQKKFNADEIEVIAVFADDVFTPELVRAIDRVTTGVQEVPGVYRVHSLTSAKVIESRGAFNASVEKLVERPPGNAAEVAELRRRALDSALVRGNLVSEDGRAAAIVVEIDPQEMSFEKKRRLLHGLERVVQRQLPPEVERHFAGALSLEQAFFTYTERDFFVLVPAGMVTVIFLCLLLLQWTLVAWAPLFVVILACLWSFGLMGALGIDINIISTSLITLILAVGIADGVHVVSAYYRELAAGSAREQAVVRGTAHLIIPCFFTSSTTIAGFLSLLIADIKPVFQFSYLAAAGVAFAFLLSMTLLPAALSVIPAPAPEKLRGRQARLMNRTLGWLSRPSRGRSLGFASLALVVVVGAGFSLPRLIVGANPMSYFRQQDPVRASIFRVDSALGGTGSFEMVAKTKPGGLKEPKVLRRIAELERRVEGVPGISQVYSVLDPLREVRRSFTDGRPESALLPDTRPMAAQFYLVLEGDEDFRSLILGDYETTRITARVKLSNTQQVSGRVEEFEQHLQQYFRDEELWIDATGYLKLIDQMENYILNSQIKSLLIAFLVITVMMGMLLGSVRLAFFSMIPNFIPILTGLAFMAWAGIDLNPGTVMIGSMALGLVVDDTVHFLVRLRSNLKQSDMTGAIAQTMEQTGRPIIATSLILACGFSTTMLGSFTPPMFYGLVSAIVVVIAAIADLVLLPAALVLINPRIRPRRRAGARPAPMNR